MATSTSAKTAAAKSGEKKAPARKQSTARKAPRKAAGDKAAGNPAASKKAAGKPEKVKKTKLVRDSFTMPETEYSALAEVKKICLKAGVEVKKSQLLRIGVALVRKMDPATLKGMLASLPPVKAGRPKKAK